MSRATPSYVELHCHSNFSFQEGASFPHELLLRAEELGYSALALTDHDNLCGAMEFARLASSMDIHPIIGAEVTLKGGSHLTLLSETGKGYSNLCRLLSYAYATTDHREPELDPRLIPEHAEGIIALSGCPKGEIPGLLMESRSEQARSTALRYMEWFGPKNLYLELQQNLVYGDTSRVRRLVALGRELGINVVATNNVHYHVRERHGLQDTLVSIRACKSLDETHRERRANSEFYLKSPEEMMGLFRKYPQAIEDTLVIAERCAFDLTKELNYRFPDYAVPPEHTPETYLEHLCREAAIRRYGSITPQVKERLWEEFRLISKYNLAGFLLIYHDVIQLARDVMIDLGLVDREIPLEEYPPGRGRGSSVAMLVGYLIGLSHIDPLQYNLSLERFLPEDSMAIVPDIDLDFPRNIREELIKRVHEKYGWDHAALTGMFSTYKLKGEVRDIGKALGLPAEDIDKLARRVDNGRARSLSTQMLTLPEYRDRVQAPGWRDLISLSNEIDGFPKYLAQHPGGMIISSTPLIDAVPVQPGAIEDRYICHWDKESIEDGSFIKIDFLSLGALSQMQEALQLIEHRTGEMVDLSRIDFDDKAVYSMLHRADTIGIFQVESAAQMQVIGRIKPENLTDMAHEVGAVRPGVGVNDGVRIYIRRRSGIEPVAFDHELERRALERTLGVILFQDQFNQVAIDVGGLSPSEADALRRAFLRKNNTGLVAHYRGRFLQGAASKGVDEETARKIFGKINGQYMFPESHAFAFGITAYQMAWLKQYHPLEFYVAIFNQQPMGFYNLETLKEDAKRRGISVLGPDINMSLEKCTIEEDALRMGLLNVFKVGEVAAETIVKERGRRGPYESIADLMQRTRSLQETLENLADAGALDSLRSGRRSARWEIGLRYRPRNSQFPLALPVEQDMVTLPDMTDWERMAEEYRTMGVFPGSHVMEMLRPGLGAHVLSSQQILNVEAGKEVEVAGLVIRRQHPLAKAVFITLEDEFGHIPVIAWSSVYERLKHKLQEPIVLVRGTVTRKEGTLNIVASDAQVLDAPKKVPAAKNWG